MHCGGLVFLPENFQTLEGRKVKGSRRARPGYLLVKSTGCCLHCVPTCWSANWSPSRRRPVPRKKKHFDWSASKKKWMRRANFQNRFSHCFHANFRLTSLRSTSSSCSMASGSTLLALAALFSPKNFIQIRFEFFNLSSQGFVHTDTQMSYTQNVRKQRAVKFDRNQ